MTFGSPQVQLPRIAGVLAIEGSGRSWSVVHECSLDDFGAEIYRAGGEIADTRHATLEEIFLARAGRNTLQNEAA